MLIITLEHFKHNKASYLDNNTRKDSMQLFQQNPTTSWFPVQNLISFPATPNPSRLMSSFGGAMDYLLPCPHPGKGGLPPLHASNPPDLARSWINRLASAHSSRGWSFLLWISGTPVTGSSELGRFLPRRGQDPLGWLTIYSCINKRRAFLVRLSVCYKKPSYYVDGYCCVLCCWHF